MTQVKGIPRQPVRIESNLEDHFPSQSLLRFTLEQT